MRLRPHEAALATLKAGDFAPGEWEARPFQDVKSAVEFLTLFTGVDFGPDYDQWSAWFAARGPEYIKDRYDWLETYSKQLKRPAL